MPAAGQPSLISFLGWAYLLWVVYWLLPVRFRFPFLTGATALLLAWELPWALVAVVTVAALSWLGARCVSPGLLIVTILAVLLAQKADGIPLRLVGFSYLAFNAMHFLAEYRAKNPRATGMPLGTYLSYLLFLPKFFSGPLSRLEDFVPENQRLEPAGQLYGLLRLTAGLVKKIVIVGALAPYAAPLTAGTGTRAELILALYAYALFLYLDFSAYTDIAIGLGRLFGVKLCENFCHPYFRRNLQEFWNNWHMSLTLWIRYYIFIPLGKVLYRGFRTPAKHVLLMSFIAMMATMMLIGLWHGLTAHFLLWGAYHGLGLFAVKALDYTLLTRYATLRLRLRRSRTLAVISGVVTFHFVTAGWLLFACDLATAARVARVITGLA